MAVAGQSSQTSNDGDVVSDIGAEIKVALDRWSAGQIGLSDLAVAGAIVAVAAFAAWVIRRLSVRWTQNLEGPAARAGLVMGQLVSAAVYLLALALVLEVLGFGLGPVVIIVLVVTVAVLFLQPLIQNMSSGLLLQLRGPFAPGDIVETSGVTGVVEEVTTRTVVLITTDCKTAHIPSRDVLDHTLVNHSAVGRRRSTISLRSGADIDVARVSTELGTAVERLDPVLSDPSPEVAVTGFEGSQLCIDVLFWHGPEMSSDRTARHAVSRAVVATFDTLDLSLADPIVNVTASTTVPPPEASG